jgi:hypothetical protein
MAIVTKTKAIRLASVLVGLLLAPCLRIYPGKLAHRSTWNRGDVSWQYDKDRVSLIDIVRQGFVYSPMVADAEVKHTRQPVWLLVYFPVLLACIVAVYMLLRGTHWISRQIRPSMGRLWTNKLRKALVAYVGLSMIAHVMLLYQFAVGGSSRSATTANLLVAFIKEPLEVVTLPCLFVNHLVVWFLTYVNSFVCSNTSPALGLANVPRYQRIFGPYHFGGLVWESLCIVLILAFWTLAIPRVGRLLERLFGRPKAA